MTWLVSVAVPVDAPPFSLAVITEVQVADTDNPCKVEPLTPTQVGVPDESDAVPVADAFARKVANNVPSFCPVGENPATFVDVPPDAMAFVICPSSKNGSPVAKDE